MLFPLVDWSVKVTVNTRIASETLAGLAQLGVRAEPLPRYDCHMGTFQRSWRGQDGRLRSTAGPRRAGKAAAL